MLLSRSPIYIILFAVLLGSSSCHRKIAAPAKEVTYGPEKDSSGLGFLTNANGIYPSESKIFDNAGLQSRLRNMLLSDYGAFVNLWQVEAPAEIRDDLFYTSGTQTKESNDPGAIFMADLSRNLLYVAIRRNRQVKVYSEDGSQPPARMIEWVNEP